MFANEGNALCAFPTSLLLAQLKMIPGFRILNVFAEAGMMEGLTFLTVSALRHFGADGKQLHELRAACSAIPAGKAVA